MIKYIYDIQRQRIQFQLYDEKIKVKNEEYTISLIYNEYIGSEPECMVISDADNMTNEKICEEIIIKLKNKLISWQLENIQMPLYIIKIVCHSFKEYFHL
jgi:hypothetical protein